MFPVPAGSVSVQVELLSQLENAPWTVQHSWHGFQPDLGFLSLQFVLGALSSLGESHVKQKIPAQVGALS